MRQEAFSLAEGDATIQWPERISQENLGDFNNWLIIFKRKIGRSVLPPDKPASTTTEAADE